MKVKIEVLEAAGCATCTALKERIEELVIRGSWTPMWRRSRTPSSWRAGAK